MTALHVAAHFSNGVLGVHLRPSFTARNAYWSEADGACKVLLCDDSRTARRQRQVPAPTERYIESLVEFTRVVVEQSGPTTWYRGVGNNEKHKLVPGLYRHPDEKLPGKLLDYEARIIQRFKARSEPYRDRPIHAESNWDLLFLMQHYGVPTRLLDWTENPYFGLFFALTQAKLKENSSEPVYENDAAVWILKQYQWNKKALPGYTVPDTLTAANVTIANSFMPGGGAAGVTFSDPIALYGSYNSARIVAQRGVFTMFGNSATPMEEVFEQNNYPEDCLVKLVIPKELIGHLLKTLTNIGVTDSVIFPDLDGLAREIKRAFEYRI